MFNRMYQPLTRHKRTRSVAEIIRAYYTHTEGARWIIVLIAALALLDAAMQAVMPRILGYVIDSANRHTTHFVRHDLPWLLPTVIIGTVVFYIVAFTWHYLNNITSQRIGIRFRLSLYNHLQQLSADFYQRPHVGEITARLTNDINQGVVPLFSQATQLVWALSVPILSCIIMATISIKLLVIFLAVAAAFVVLMRTISPRIRSLNREVMDEAGRMNARMTEDISVNTLIRAFAQENASLHALEQLSDVLYGKVKRSARFTTLFSDIINTFLVWTAPLAILITGALFASKGLITIGAAAAFFAYWKTASGPISFTMGSLTVLYSAFASVDRILDFFGECPLVKNKKHARPLQVTQGEVTLREVTFSYPIGSGEPVLSALSFTAAPQQSLALVGESGAGKSTIVQLILRFYDAGSGAVRIDGQDVRDVAQASLRRQIGMVMQDTILLSGTIRENMLFAKPDASEEEIIAALQHAEAWSFIQEMPDGLDTMLGERGARLSGGQKQRISIARVFLKNPPIVIFDEATSSLDTITEKQIQQTMRRLYQGRTAIIIAHRLSTIIDCDRIIVLDKGCILAEGSHEELYVACPRYREMCEKQEMAQNILHSTITLN